jgi:putative ABC transport system substrate-binding protein
MGGTIQVRNVEGPPFRREDRRAATGRVPVPVLDSISGPPYRRAVPPVGWEAVMLNRRAFLWGFMGSAIAAPLAADGNQARKAAKIGILQPGPRPPAWVASFREGLRELGYIDGRNVVIEHRLAHEISEHPALAAELARLNVDVIFTWSTPAALAVKRTTSTIPVVAITGNPVDIGLAASLGRPEGNVTGIAVLDDQLELKRLQLLREGLPEVTRIAVLWNPANPIWSPLVRRLQDTAPTFGVAVHSVAARNPSDLTSALTVAKRDGVQALLIVNEGVFNANPKAVVDAVMKSALPAIYSQTEFAGVGGLMAYSPDFPDMFRRAAFHVDKILRGAKPADLPIEQPTKFEFVINLKTAQALGLTIPPSLLLRADQVIE